MNPHLARHLTGEQISKYLIGDATPQETQHIRDCAVCGAEVARLESSFAHFRGSVRRWSDQPGHTAQDLRLSTPARLGRNLQLPAAVKVPPGGSISFRYNGAMGKFTKD